MDNSLESTGERREIFWDHFSILYKARQWQHRWEKRQLYVK